MNKILSTVSVWLVLLIATGLPLSRASAQPSKVAEALVKINTVFDTPRYWTPWSMNGPASSSGSGCIIEGNRILTNAHVVSDQTYIEIQRHGESKRVPARVESVHHEADLALLAVDEPDFFDGVEPLSFGELPPVQAEVLVYGFPMGGDTLSVTKGVVSRLEHQTYVHSSALLLAGQIDAAINPGNSGGPVLYNGKIVGVVMQGMDAQDADNIGYMVPVNVVAHYLKDLEDGTLDGFPVLGINHYTVENQSAKNYYKLPQGATGRLIIRVHPASPFRDTLRAGDILTAMDGQPIADDGTVEFRPKERTNLAYLIQRHQMGEELQMTILRGGQRLQIKSKLTLPFEKISLVAPERYDTRPSYFIYGGLVFSKLTKDLLMAWGENWMHEAPKNLLATLYYNQAEEADEEVVVLMRVLPSKLTSGYHDISDMIVKEVNGTRPKTLQQLVSLIEGSESPYVEIVGDLGEHLVLDRKRVGEAGKKILERYEIVHDRSPDLRGERRQQK